MSSLADILKGNGFDVGDEFASNTDEYNRLMDSIRKGTGSFQQVYDFTDRTGQAASNYLKKQCESQLVNGQVPQEVADSVVNPVLQSVSQVSSETANALCSAENHKKGINVTLQNPPVDKSTANGMSNKLISGPYDQTKWIIGDGPVSNLAMHSVDQTIQANAEFITKSGRRARIRRRSEANCCDWCENLAGEWDYGEEPKDVYRRHNNCRCVVEYIVDGKAQNVWNKSDVHPDKYIHGDSNSNDNDDNSDSEVIDVKDEYLKSNKPSYPVEIPDGYDNKRVSHEDEKNTAKWLTDLFGGHVSLIREDFDKKYPDFLWEGKYWDLKTPIKLGKYNIQKLLETAKVQILEKPGGVIIEISKIKESDSKIIDSIKNAIIQKNYEYDVIVKKVDSLIGVYRKKRH